MQTAWMGVQLFLLLLCGTGGLMAQNSNSIFTLNDCWQQVRQHHPISQQARLLEAQAAQELRYARGAFDPKLYGELDQKTFDGKNYFTHANGGLKIPTLWGPVLKAEYDWTNTNGVFVNPENNLPTGGQAVLGLEVPLFQGLLFDENRSQLRQAQEGQRLYAAQARELRNMLFLETNKAYWDWAWAYHALELTEQALRYSRDRLDGLREGFRQGDYPAIDTLEAFLQVQQWQLEQQEATILSNHAIARLQALVWDERGRPTVWDPNWMPEHPGQWQGGLSPDSLRTQLSNHPSLETYRSQLRQLQLERRWKTEQLKPDLRVSFNLLGDQFNLNPGDDSGLRDLVTDNYKLGVKFAYPLFLRKQRAGVALTDIKVANTEWKLRQKEQELLTKFQAYEQEFNQRNQQVELAGELVGNYRTLLEAEQVKFQLGESSVFLLNSRQQKLLEAQLKWLKTQAEQQKAAASLRWVAGEN